MILLLNADQSEVASNPLFVAEAVGRLKVWTEPEETMLKSVPEVPVAKVWVAVDKPLREVMAELMKDGVTQTGAEVPLDTRYCPAVPTAEMANALAPE